MQGVLNGRDHTEYGEIAVSTVTPDVALALTRGRFPKPYRFVDPNEDVVAGAVGARATLLVVADAHNGRHASEAAVGHLLRHVGADPPPADLSDPELVDLFDGVNRAVLAVTADLSPPHATSTTTLTVAFVGLPDARSRRRLQYAAIGDSALIVARPGWGEELTEPQHRFMGSPLSRFEIAGRLQRGVVEVSPTDWVVLVSDGFTNFVGPERAGAVVGEVLRPSMAPVDAARALITRAGDEGAGDNVAVAVTRALDEQAGVDRDTVEERDAVA